MAIYQVKDPAGQTHEIRGPDGASPDQVIEQAKNLIPQNPTLEPSYSDIPTNALSEAKASASQAPGMLKNLAALTAIPSGGIPTLDDFRQMKTLPAQALDMGKGTLENLYNTITNPKQELIQHPIGTALNALAIGGLATKGLAGLGEAMRNKGASLATDLGEVSADTVKKLNPQALGEEAQPNIRMAGSTPNIADVRQEVGAKLVKDKVVGGFGQDLGDRIQEANKLENSYGQKVDSALKDIRDANAETGANALLVDAKPVLDEVSGITNDLSGSARSGIRQTARFWKETLNSLTKKAEANQGKLSIDDIRSEMQDVGKDMKAGAQTPRYGTAKDIYGHLANVRDQIVNDIADRAGNPDLANNLKEANRGYSLYSKVSKDLGESGAGGDVPEKLGKHIVRGIMSNNPEHITKYLGLRKILNAIEPSMAQKLVDYGGVLKKTPQVPVNVSPIAISSLIDQLKKKYDERRKFF